MLDFKIFEDDETSLGIDYYIDLIGNLDDLSSGNHFIVKKFKTREELLTALEEIQVNLKLAIADTISRIREEGTD